VVLESDKASMEVPSPLAGKIVSINIAVGDTISEGGLVLELETDTASPESVEPAAKAETGVAAVEEVAVAESTVKANETVTAPAQTSNTGDSHLEAIIIPDIGGAEAVDVIEVCVAIGDQLSEGDSLLVLETDKASMEIPSPYAGRIASIAIAEGGQVSEGDIIREMEVGLQADKPSAQELQAPVKKPADETAVAVQKPVAQSIPKPGNGEASFYAGPAVRKMARELGADLEKVSGTGPKGRIIKEDLQSFVKSALAASSSSVSGTGIPAIPAIDFAKFGDIELQPLSKIHKLTIENMQRSWLNVPHVTQFDEADITDLEAFRVELKQEAQKRETKLTPLPFLLKACAVALKEHPKFNASLHADGQQMVFKKYIHIAMAVDPPSGLMVPVIRDVDQKTIWELSSEIAELASKAKNRKLTPADMQGACFTISSLGSIGGTGFTPIVNAPEVAILGVSKLAIKPVWNGEEFLPKKMLPLSLSYDHRAVNGADGGRFFSFLAALLSDVRRLIL
jgi:pyruvate dehydrogenase E2 component (dihydrolipoamide acetyltransferase)